MVTNPPHPSLLAPVVFYNAINVLYQVLDETLCTSTVGARCCSLVRRYCMHLVAPRPLSPSAPGGPICLPRPLLSLAPSHTSAGGASVPPAALPAAVNRPCGRNPNPPLQRCPVMCAGPQYEYLWADGAKVKTPVKLSAPDYINCLFDWVEDQVEWVVVGQGGRRVFCRGCDVSAGVVLKQEEVGRGPRLIGSVPRWLASRITVPADPRCGQEPLASNLLPPLSPTRVAPAAAGQPRRVPAALRRLLPPHLWRHGAQHPQAPFPSVRPHLPLTLPVRLGVLLLCTALLACSVPCAALAARCASRDSPALDSKGTRARRQGNAHVAVSAPACAACTAGR
jgi:hypothetical protein